ncbi:hypothetical protein D5S17_31695 [Pseudonocardiaceae bacterium YIM PH 21723]|nr:hypothetical protein D5S17_31695 [Pseudonocardiaceae bacterium YIM PH 21723]
MSDGLPASGRKEWHVRKRVTLIGMAATVLVAAVALVVVAPGTPSVNTENSGQTKPYIVGGADATGAYPFYAALFVSGQFGCGGSLIAPTWVATAKHCISPQAPDTVRIGGTTKSTGEQRRVRRVVQGSGDFGLIELASASSKTPIPITQQKLTTGTPVRIIGLGQTCPQRGECGPATDLQQLDTTLVAGCTDPQFNGRTELCVGDTRDKGACFGDSGGPLVVQGVNGLELGGATSRAGSANPACAQAPSIYTNVSALTAFITKTTGLDTRAGSTSSTARPTSTVPSSTVRPTTTRPSNPTQSPRPTTTSQPRPTSAQPTNPPSGDCADDPWECPPGQGYPCDQDPWACTST